MWALGSATSEEWSRILRGPSFHTVIWAPRNHALEITEKSIYDSEPECCSSDGHFQHISFTALYKRWHLLLTLCKLQACKTVLPIIWINTNTICLAPFNSLIILINTQTTSVHRQKYRYLCRTHFLKHCTKFSVDFCYWTSGSYLSPKR